MLTFSKKYFFLTIIFLAILVGVVIFLIINSQNGKYEYFTVLRKDVSESVELAGKVQSIDLAELGFESSGRVESVMVEVGDEVERGDVLISLDSSDLYADLADTKEEVNIKLAELQNVNVDLADVTMQQDVLVENAKRTMLSSDLYSEPQSRSSELEAPIITGNYRGESGEYKFRILKDSITDLDYYFNVFGIENFSGKIEQVRANPFGSLGLYIQLPDAPSSYDDTTWYVRIPNVKGENYVSNLSAYNNALENKTVAIRDVEEELDSGNLEYSIAQSELKKAEAKLQRIESLIQKNVIRAPFSGTISSVRIEVGEISQPGSPVVTLVSEGAFEVILDVPENDIAKLDVGDKTEVMLDAFGKDKSWRGVVSAISQGETYVDGVPVYETVVQMETEEGDNLRSGLSSTVSIVTDEKKDVVTIPLEFIQKDSSGEYFVHKLIEGDKLERVYVEVGLEGSDGMLEIVDGLKENDIIGILKEDK